MNGTDIGTGGTPDSLLPRMLSRVLGSRLLRSSAVYATSNILNRAIPFLLLPVLTRYLSPADFGKAAMFTVAVSLAMPLVGFCTDNAVSRQYFERERIDFGNYITNCLYIWGITALLVLVVVLATRHWIASWLELPAWVVWTVVVAAAARYITSVVLVVWQVQNRPKPYATYLLLQTATTFGFTLFFVVVLDYG